MNGLSLIVGNICSLLAMITDSISATRKTAKGVLWVQNISQLCYCIGTIVLKGYSGAVQNVISILRNLVAIRNVENKITEWVLLLLGVVLGLVFNNLGLFGLFPVIANLQYTIVVFRCNGNERALKISFLISAIMFAAFSGAIWNVVGVITNLTVAVTTAICLIKQKPTEESDG